MEGHVEQHEDDEEDDRQQHLQALACPNLKLVLSRPRQRVSDRDLELTLNGQPRLGYIAADVAGRGVDRFRPFNGQPGRSQVGLV